jgi:hypothetical protein
MSGDRQYTLTRRMALAGLAASCATGLAKPASAAAEDIAGPTFSPSGPNAEFFGAAENYPIKDPALAFVRVTR